MPGSDVQRASEWIVTRLAGDATLMALVNGVYDGDAPPGAVYPFVQLAEAGNHTSRGMGGLRVLVNSLVLIKVIGETWSFDAIQPAAERVDALLDGVVAESSALVTLDCSRDSEHKASYVEDRISYRELGGYYRLIVRST